MPGESGKRATGQSLRGAEITLTGTSVSALSEVF